MAAESSWRVTVPPSAGIALHKLYGAPSMLLGINGFWATLRAERGQLTLLHRDRAIVTISNIEGITVGTTDNGYGTWFPAVIVKVDDEEIGMMPYERPGLLPHTVMDPSAMASELRAIVFGATS